MHGMGGHIDPGWVIPGRIAFLDANMTDGARGAARQQLLPCRLVGSAG